MNPTKIDEKSDMERERRIEAARARMAALTSDFCKILPPHEVVDLMVACGTAVLLAHGSRDDVAAYLRRMADQVEHDDGPPVAGNA